ncbi:MAG: hypothetical protein ACI8TQ_000023 [Planctomycetota bacterium]|jgi:hypothetical protein
MIDSGEASRRLTKTSSQAKGFLDIFAGFARFL